MASQHIISQKFQQSHLSKIFVQNFSMKCPGMKHLATKYPNTKGSVLSKAQANMKRSEF